MIIGLDLCKHLKALRLLNKVGNLQEIETPTNEEALLFAKYLKGETKEWNPRIVNL